ncbi:zinc-finger domain-containing protein [Acidocella sp.]|jgi:uncharacterized Zn-finger protein|uniref:zinc-finger domain-containing protein n=1 Tax=Acidocella sp. TaxID=50710 RepID=UPI002F3FD66C
MDATAQKTPTEIIHVKTSAVSCDGGNGAYGHPRVYLKIPDTQITRQIMCPYCSKLFVLEPGATDSAH